MGCQITSDDNHPLIITKDGSGGVILQADNNGKVSFPSGSDVGNKLNSLIYNAESGVTTSVSDGKVVIKTTTWWLCGFYFLIIAVDSQEIWSYLASFIWGFKIIDSNVANAALSDVTITGNRRDGLTITVTNSKIKANSNVRVTFKGIQLL